jgi:tRNA pseudouridine38-40 synthase
MPNYKIVLEYDGTDYHGWQRQPALPTVQGAMEEAIGHVARMESPLYAAGRTDAGVHARGQVVNFHGSLKMPPERLPAALNGLLPPDIAVKHCEETGADFNARRSAWSREYIYYVQLGEYPSPFHLRFAYHFGGSLDEGMMGKALECVTGVHDFASFCRNEEGKSSVREVYEVGMMLRDEILGIRVKANAFVWMMMRMLCGSLLEVGRGKWSVEHFQEVLEGGDNSLSGPALPPRGLILERVYY